MLRPEFLRYLSSETELPPLSPDSLTNWGGLENDELHNDTVLEATKILLTTRVAHLAAHLDRLSDNTIKIINISREFHKYGINMRHLGCMPCKADPDVWIKAAVRPDDGHEHYSYILLYVDDLLCVHHSAEEQIRKVDKYFSMKPDSIGDPDICLGGKLN